MQYILEVACVLVAALLAAPAAGAGERDSAMKDSPGIEIVDAAFKAVAGPEAKVRRIAEGLKFTEGPVWDKAGKRLLFSDIPADTIYQWTEAEGLKVWRTPSHNANGNTADRDGRIVTCEHGSRTVTRTDAAGKVETLCATYQGKRLNSPNDAVVGRDGAVWFTDPPYGIDPKTREQAGNYVFRLDPGAKEPVPVATDFAMPNGLCFSPDGKWLYVADSGGPHHIRRFRVKDDRTLEGGEVFATITPGGPDGIRCDREGRLYSTAGDGVQVFSPEGKLIGRIRTPEPAANCAFGGPDGRTLFITARASVWAVTLAAAGAE